MTVKGIIFDLDGTLLYTLEDLTNSVNFALKNCGLKERSIDEIKSFVGNGIIKLIERAIGDNQDKFNECHKLFLEDYKINSTKTTHPYKNSLETLLKLKERGIKLAILSNKNDDEVKKLSKYYFKDIFDISLGKCPEFDKKPDSKSTNFIIEKLNLKKEQTLFIGDSEVDILTAQNAGLKCLSVSWGYKTKEFLAKNKAQEIFDDFNELYEFIISL